MKFEQTYKPDFDISKIDNLIKDMKPREAIETCLDIAHYNFSKDLALEKEQVPSAIAYCYALIENIESKLHEFSRLDTVYSESLSAIYGLRTFIMKLTEACD